MLSPEKWIENPESQKDWSFLNKEAEKAYFRLAPDEFRKQERFVKSRIDPNHKIGSIYTTLSINRYGEQMPGMGYHIDNPRVDAGLTTISVFDEGRYEGGLFVVPRYRLAFRVGDGDVFVSNSREIHGVTRISGSGKRLSVVSYTQTALGVEEVDSSYPAKSTALSSVSIDIRLRLCCDPIGNLPKGCRCCASWRSRTLIPNEQRYLCRKRWIKTL